MTLRPLLLALALSFAMPMTTYAHPATDTASPDGTLLTLSASGEATRVPDVARVSTGVVTQSPEANVAMRENASRMVKVMTALHAAGIAERDIQTSGIHLNPQYKYQDNTPPTIVAYQASNTVNVKVRDLSKLGKVLDTLVAQGANQIDGPSFELDKPEAAIEEARVAAIKKAQAQAQTYAQTLGMHVRRIVSISESSTNYPRPMPRMMMAAAMSKESDTAVAPGETSLSVSVSMVFELGR